MIKMVIVAGGDSYAIGDNVGGNIVDKIELAGIYINFYDDSNNIIMSLFGGSYALIY